MFDEILEILERFWKSSVMAAVAAVVRFLLLLAAPAGPVWVAHKALPTARMPSTERRGHPTPPDKPTQDPASPPEDVKGGAFPLTRAQAERIPADEDLRLTEDMLAGLPEGLKGKATIDPEGRLLVQAEPDH